LKNKECEDHLHAVFSCYFFLLGFKYFPKKKLLLQGETFFEIQRQKNIIAAYREGVSKCGRKIRHAFLNSALDGVQNNR
jgi:hypothetical protein